MLAFTRDVLKQSDIDFGDLKFFFFTPPTPSEDVSHCIPCSLLQKMTSVEEGVGP